MINIRKYTSLTPIWYASPQITFQPASASNSTLLSFHHFSRRLFLHCIDYAAFTNTMDNNICMSDFIMLQYNYKLSLLPRY